MPPGQKTTATVATQARTDHAWSDTTQLTNTLNFRYSALTWNAHRIHYDGDYTRSEEGYPALVSERRPVHASDGRCRAAATPRAR